MIPHVITASGHAVSLLCDDPHQLPHIPAPTPPLSPSSRTTSQSSAPPSVDPGYQPQPSYQHNLPPIPPYSDHPHSVAHQAPSSSFNEAAYPPSQEPYSSSYSYARGQQYNGNYTYASPPPPAPAPAQQWYVPSQTPQPPRQDQSGYNMMPSPPLAEHYQSSSTARPYQHARSVSPLTPSANMSSIPPVTASADTSPRRPSQVTKYSPSPPPPTSAAAAASGAEPVRKTRRYTCHCGKSFTTSGHLARHMRIHTGEKNYVCPEKGCGARFSRQDNCMQHYRTHQAQGAKRNSLGLAAANGSLRAVTTGVASPAAIQAARRRRSSHSGVVAAGRQPGPVAVAAAAATAAAAKRETNQEFRTHHHQRHSVDYTPTGGYPPSYYDPRYKAERATPELPPLPSPQQAPYKPQYSPRSPFSPLPPPALPQQSFPSQYHTLAPRQPQPSHLQYQSAQQPQYSSAPSSLPLPVMQASPSASADAAASRLDELASIATQVAV